MFVTIRKHKRIAAIKLKNVENESEQQFVAKIVFTSTGTSPMVSFTTELSHEVDDDNGEGVLLSELPASYQTLDRVMDIITQMAQALPQEDEFMDIAERTLN